jgi:hypothetical protein
MHTFGLETGLACELAQDEEDAGTREPSALGIEEELGAVP